MEKLKNKSGSTMLLTIVLIALFGIMLVGFHTAIITMTTRLDSTYSEKQAYLYSRSAVTALANELMRLNKAYDDAWDDYKLLLDAYNNPTEGTTPVEPSEPVKPQLLAKVDGLADGATLDLTDCKFGDTLVDKYELKMDVTRVTEQNSSSNDVAAYILSATTTIQGIKDVSDTVSIKLSTTGKSFDITVGGGESDSFNPESGLYGIYTDNEIHLDWGSYFLTGIENGAEVICNEPVDYTLENSLSGGESGGVIRNNGSMTFEYNSRDIVIENIDFYVNGDLILTNPSTSIKLVNCNIYTTGEVRATIKNKWVTPVSFLDCNIYCAKFSVILSDTNSETTPILDGTTINATGTVTLDDLDIPARPKPTWVSDLEILQREHPEQILPFSRVSAPMEAGKTYKLVDVQYYPFTKYDGIEDNDIPDATAESPITIIVPSDMSAALEDSCGPNIHFYIEPKGELTVHTDSFLDNFEANIYSPQVTGTDNISVDFWRATNFRGTIIVPSLKISADKCTFGGTPTPVTPPTTTPSTTKPVEYPLYTNYIYVR